jgi:hypothetical protein
VAEQYADGLASAEELATKQRATPFADEFSIWVTGDSAYDGAWQVIEWLTSALDLMKIDPDALRHFPIPAHDLVKRSVLFLHDISGNPFRPVTLDPTWLTPKVKTLAQAIYDDRAFERMPVLADALEEAGCTNADILDHCRKPGEHVRGCWVVDLALGKT